MVIEIDVGFDDGFNNTANEAYNEYPRVVYVANHSGIKKLIKNAFNGLNLERPIHEFITRKMKKENVLEDEYLTEELDSASESDSDCEGRPHVIRFNK